MLLSLPAAAAAAAAVLFQQLDAALPLCFLSSPPAVKILDEQCWCVKSLFPSFMFARGTLTEQKGLPGRGANNCLHGTCSNGTVWVRK